MHPPLGKEDNLNKEEKQQLIEELKGKFLRAKGVVFTDYKGMTVAELGELRRTLERFNIEYKVVKNTLARIASADTPVSAAGKDFTGPVAVAIGYDDAAAVAKRILEFSKKNRKLKVAGGVMDGSYCNAQELKAVAELPPREVLLGMLAGTMQAPIGKLARLFAATLQGFAYALTALKEQKQTAG